MNTLFRVLLTLSLGTTLSFYLMSCAGQTEDDDEDEAEQLDMEHPGWGNPGCWANGCHTEEDTHNPNLQPYECVGCHGNNGAPSTDHPDDTPCGDCHPDHHGNNGFPDPESCQTCHG